jgi:MFS family permease
MTWAGLLAATFFLSQMGAAGLSLYFLLFAACSIPLSLGLSRVIDKLAHISLLQGVLALVALLAIAIPLLSPWLGGYSYLLLYLAVTVLEVMVWSLFYALFADYFNATEGKRYSTRLAAAMAMGALLGAIGMAATTYWLTPQLALYGVCLIMALAVAELVWLRRNQRQPEALADDGVEETLLGSLAKLPALMRSYPIIPLLAAAIFLNNLLQGVAEYNAFDIYLQAWPDERAMASFLGIMVAIQSLATFLFSLWFTPWLIRRFGVAGANLIYPLLLMSIFVWLLFDQSLPAAIYTFAIIDPVSNSIDLPLFLLNYNAIPHRQIARVRLLNDGIVYSLSLAMVGLLLLFMQSEEDKALLNFFALLLALLYVVTAVWIGRYYLRGIKQQLRSGMVDLDDLPQLPQRRKTVEEIASLLDHDEASQRAVALALVIQLPHTDLMPAVMRAASASDTFTLDRWLDLLSFAPAIWQQAVAQWWREQHPVLSRLGLVALIRWGSAPPDLLAAAEKSGREPLFWAMAMSLAGEPQQASRWLASQPRIGHEEVLAAIKVAEACHDRSLWPLFAPWQQSDDERIAARMVVFNVRLGDRAIAIRQTIQALQRPGPCWQLAAREALSLLREEGLIAVKGLLMSDLPYVRQGVLRLCGQLQGATATAIRESYLQQQLNKRIHGYISILRAIPAEDPAWQLLTLAAKNGLIEATSEIIALLEGMVSPRTLKAIRILLATNNGRRRSHAIETLASLPQRHFLLPLLPWLEGEVVMGSEAARSCDPQPLLHFALNIKDRWVVEAARIVWRQFDLPPLAVGTTRDELPMIQLQFLQSVSLFHALSLDDLLAISQVMTSEIYLSGESVVRQGELGEYLYLIERGSMAVIRRSGEAQQELAILGAGEAFGEMALFDDQPRAASVVAREESHLYSLSREQFHSLTHQRPEILWQFCRLLTQRLRGTG